MAERYPNLAPDASSGGGSTKEPDGVRANEDVDANAAVRSAVRSLRLVRVAASEVPGGARVGVCGYETNANAFASVSALAAFRLSRDFLSREFLSRVVAEESGDERVAGF